MRIKTITRFVHLQWQHSFTNPFLIIGMGSLGIGGAENASDANGESKSIVADTCAHATYKQMIRGVSQFVAGGLMALSQ